MVGISFTGTSSTSPSAGLMVRSCATISGFGAKVDQQMARLLRLSVSCPSLDFQQTKCPSTVAQDHDHESWHSWPALVNVKMVDTHVIHAETGEKKKRSLASFDDHFIVQFGDGTRHWEQPHSHPKRERSPAHGQICQFYKGAAFKDGTRRMFVFRLDEAIRSSIDFCWFPQRNTSFLHLVGYSLCCLKETDGSR